MTAPQYFWIAATAFLVLLAISEFLDIINVKL